MTRRQVGFAVAGTVLAFALAMFLVTGIEWIKGGTITGGGTGTSIGNVVSGTPTGQIPQDDTGGGDATSSPEPTTSTAPDPTSSSPATPSPSSTSAGEDSSESGAPVQDGLNGVLPSAQPESGQLQSGPDDSGAADDGATGSG